ncbi:hypothetical protein ACINJI_004387 [Cronobacter dublinensis]
MNQLEEIIAILSSEDEGTTNALLKTKVLLYSIGKKDLATWVNYELNGYPDDQVTPDYRIVSARVLADVNNGVRIYRAFPLLLHHLNDEDYQNAVQSHVKISISQIEQLVLNAGDSQTLQQPIPLEIAYLLYSKNVNKGYELTSCYKEIALHNFTYIMTQVRSRLLDFILESSGHVSTIPGASSVTEKLKDVDSSSLFSKSIFGDNTVINMGHSNSFTITNNLAKNDIDALKKHLIAEGVTDADAHELEVAINSDGPIAPRSRNYGSAVSHWFSGMISKAASGAAGMGVTATTELLSSALKKFYGLD